MSENEDANKKSESKSLDDEALERLAVEELMREAVQGAARAEVIGPSGWVRKSSQLKTNKRFLANTIRHAVASNQLKSSITKARNGNKSPKSKSSITKARNGTKSPKSKRKSESNSKSDRLPQKY